MDLKMEVYTPGLELIGFLEIQRSVIWEEKAFSSGSFSVESLITPESLALLQPENIIWIEGETAGIIEYVQEEAGENGPYITVKGCTMTGILKRRILWGLYNLKGTPPAIMHALVNDCCINPTRGDVEARKIPGLVLLDAPAGGDVIRFQKTGGDLLEALEHLGATYGVAFGVRFNATVPRMEFWTRWGRNLTVRQSDNPQVFYSTELDDVLASEYFYNAQDYRNVALVAGEGEGSDRTYMVVEGEMETPDVPVPPQPPTPPEPTKYTVTLLVDPAGGGVASGGKTVAAGVSITVTATPSAGHTFVGWSENGSIVSTSASYTFTVNADRTLTAVFAAVVPTYTVTASIDPAGSGTVTGAGQYQEGAQVTLTATPANGYTFSEWQEDGETISEDAEYTFTVTGPRALEAVFKKFSRLPDGYTEVEYIQSEGYCRIDTGLNPFAKQLKTEMDVWPLSATGFGYFFYSYRQGNSRYYYICYYKTSVIQASMGTSSNAAVYTQPIIQNPDSKRMNVVYSPKSKTAAVDEISVEFSNSTFVTNMTNVYLLGLSSSDYLTAKLYSCKMYNELSTSALVRDFVPCIDPSGAVGLYDLVEGTFYANSGTGTLTAGPAV